jgi:hypothetical protein
MKAKELAEMLMVKPEAEVLIDVAVDGSDIYKATYDENIQRHVVANFGVDNEYFLESNVILLEL